MALKINPTELVSPIAPDGKRYSVEEHRNLFCEYYDGCLDLAVKKGWNSFTCVRCPKYNSKSEWDGIEMYATQRKSA